jgi:hypothetical protein
MRSIYLFIFLLLSVAVAADIFDIFGGPQATYTISVVKGSDEYSVDEDLHGDPYTFDFGSTAYTTTIVTAVHMKPCAGSDSFTGCGTVSLCLTPEGQSQICKTLANQEDQNVTFPLDRNTKVIIFSITGSRDTGGDYDALIVTATRNSGLIKSFTKYILALRGQKSLFLGKVRDLIDTTNASEATISSSTAVAPAWFDDGTGSSATSRTTTSNFNDNTYSCLNSDGNLDSSGNPQCDFIDEAACANQGKDWLSGNCCGDAPYIPASGCQWYADKQAVCGQDAQGIWKWAALNDAGLIIAYSGSCPSVQIVSDGKKFYTCSVNISSVVPAALTANIQGKLVIQEHDYICNGENIIECGGETPYSPNALATGASITISGKKNYCNVNGTFKVSINDKTTCEKAAFKWTGTQCCGEPDDPVQTYEDAYAGTGTAGVCYNGEFLPSGTFLDAQKTILSSRGEFYQCNPAVTTTTTATLPGTSITVTVKPPCGAPLIATLLTGTKPNAVCLPSGQWQFVSFTDTTVVKQTKWTVTEGDQQKGCCPDNQCWDGKTCKSIGEYYILGERGFLCQ